MHLPQWGWSPALEQASRALALEHTVPARVVRHDRTGSLVAHQHGEAFARLPGHLRSDPPVVGDWIALDPREPATIRALLPRRTAIVRQAAGGNARAQLVAANVDLLLIVAGLDDAINERRIERYRVLAASAGIPSILVLNKLDLAPPGAGTVVPAHHERIVRTSAGTGAGIAALRALVPAGTTAAFVGPSGVGKSSLVNALLGRKALDTAAVRDADKRGRHTTTARHLLPLPDGGILLDTPGMRELGMWAAEEGIAQVFDDITELAARCRFNDCAHASEPGCAVREAVSPERLAAWRKLQREAASSALRADERAHRAAARAWGKMARDTVRAKEERLR